MGDAFAPSGTSARNQAKAEAVQQQKELDRQKLLAEQQQIPALQDTLACDTNRLARVYGTQSLLAFGGAKGRVV